MQARMVSTSVIPLAPSSSPVALMSRVVSEWILFKLYRLTRCFRCRLLVQLHVGYCDRKRNVIDWCALDDHLHYDNDQCVIHDWCVIDWCAVDDHLRRDLDRGLHHRRPVDVAFCIQVSVFRIPLVLQLYSSFLQQLALGLRFHCSFGVDDPELSRLDCCQRRPRRPCRRRRRPCLGLNDKRWCGALTLDEGLPFPHTFTMFGLHQRQ